MGMMRVTDIVESYNRGETHMGSRRSIESNSNEPLNRLQSTVFDFQMRRAVRQFGRLVADQPEWRPQQYITARDTKLFEPVRMGVYPVDDKPALVYVRPSIATKYVHRDSGDDESLSRYHLSVFAWGFGGRLLNGDDARCIGYVEANPQWKKNELAVASLSDFSDLLGQVRDQARITTWAKPRAVTPPIDIGLALGR